MNHQFSTKSYARVRAIDNLARIACVLVLLWSNMEATDAQSPKPATPCKPPQVEIVGTQLLHLTSNITNEDYDLYINLPRGYSDSTKTFPVIYLIDAQWDFPLVQAIYGQQYFDGFLPEMIIVGITWGGNNPNYDQLRAHDFTPTETGQPAVFGNAPNFLSAIKKEVIPFIEKEYRVKHDDRTLMGSSYGGLFTLFSIFTEPGLFNRYVLTSPAIQWDNKMIYSLNKSFAEKQKELAVQVFIGIGAYENVAELQNFADDLKAKNYQGMVLQTKVIEGMGHSGAKAEGYSRGLQAVFSKPELQIDPAILATYTGEYMINPELTIKLQVKQGKLIVSAPEISEIPLKAESDVDFYLTGQYLKLHFEKDQAGKITGFTLQQYGESQFCKKLN